MPNLKPLVFYVRHGARHSLVRGHVMPLLEGSGIVATWSNVERGRLVRTDRIGELCARAELDGGYIVRVRNIEGPA